MNEQNKEKLIAHLEKGTEIFLLLNDDTGIIGVVERNVLCWEETDGNWHELTVYVGGQHITINSNNVKEVRKCIPHTEDEHNQIIGRDAFEIYNVPYGLSDVDFLKTVLDSWDGLEDDAKEEITDVIAPSLTSAMLHYQNTMFERSAKDKIYEKEDGTFVIGGGKKKTYATLKEAEDIVCERNQNRIESVAEKCKGSIPMCAYEAMLNWDVRLAMCS